MHKLTFYHQKRRDGGLRTGVDFDDERVLERFEPGDLARDSALEWFVDIRCRGETLPARNGSTDFVRGSVGAARNRSYSVDRLLTSGVLYEV